MKRILIFGAGNTGMREYRTLAEGEEVIAFFDNDKTKWNTTLFGKRVLQPSKDNFQMIDYDEVLIASVQAKDEIRE